MSFEYDPKKDILNQKKHGVSFEQAKAAFGDVHRVIASDSSHSQRETRYLCYGMVEGGVLTVRFTMRGKRIRIFGAAYWRKGRKIYEKENSL